MKKRKQRSKEEIYRSIGMKVCRSCEEEKSIKDFPKDPSRADGLCGNCIPCKKAYDASHRLAKPPKVHKAMLRFLYSRPPRTLKVYGKKTA